MNSVRILFHRFEELKYIIIAEFLKFCGFFVLGVVVEDEYGLVLSYQMAHNLKLLNKQETEGISTQYDNRFIMIGDFQQDTSDSNMTEVLNNVITQMDLSLNDRNVLIQLIPFFVRNRMMQMLVSLRFMFEGEKEKREVYEGFQTICLKLNSGELVNLSDSRYGEYFAVNCKRKMNECCDMIGRPKQYNSEELVEEALAIAKRYPSFRQPYILQGLIADTEIKLAGIASVYYMQAGDVQYDDYLPYRLGHFYEKAKSDYLTALKYYRIAYEKNPGNYRALYKIGFIREWQKDYKSAESSYLKLCSILEEYAEQNYMQPIQTEYLFRTYWRLIRIYRIHLRRWYSGKIIAERAMILPAKLKQNRFMNAFYGANAQNKILALQSGMELDGVRRELREFESEIRFFES